MNQKTAYFNAITSVMSEAGIEFVENKTVCKTVMTKELRDQVIAIVCVGFQEENIPLKDTLSNKEKLADESKLKEYAISTLNNWLLKDERLNGGVKHTIKNKGSRAGQGDKFVKNYKALLTQFSPDSEQYKVIQGKIAERQAEIKASKAKTVEVNLDLIPAELREELGL